MIESCHRDAGSPAIFQEVNVVLTRLSRTHAVAAAVALAAVLAAAPAPAQDQKGQAAASDSGKKPQAPELRDKTSVTHHTARIEGQPVAYTAKAGTLVLRDASDKAIASFFYVYYTRDNVADLAKRPLVYSFNGGPGTGSLWMHIGFTGPRRVAYDENGFQLRPPYRLVDNDHSLLDAADIVYINPIGVGYSRMAPGEDPHKFHGVQADIESMGDFIRLFTTREGRWQSPKYLIGESYGTTRAAGLAGYLQSAHQMYLNGVILVSTTGLSYESGTDMHFVTALPYMTAAAWYHKKLPQDLQSQPLAGAIAESEKYAAGDYQLALFKGGLITPEERTTVAQHVSRLIGVSPEFVLHSNLRVEKQRFWKELLRDRGLTIGRLDSRYTGVDKDASGAQPDEDPALQNWNGPFGSAINMYMHDELKWETDDKYYVWGNVQPWRQDPRTHVGEMLRQAMAENPFLHTLILGGYFDGGTDFSTAHYTISHLDPSGALNSRFHFAFFESGHMLYLKDSVRAQAKQALVKFIQTTEAAAATTNQ
jgi:carboxypeptidase C (cathepsin A)